MKARRFTQRAFPGFRWDITDYPGGQLIKSTCLCCSGEVGTVENNENEVSQLIATEQKHAPFCWNQKYGDPYKK